MTVRGGPIPTDLPRILADVNRQIASHQDSLGQLYYMRRHLWAQIMDAGGSYKAIKAIQESSVGKTISDSRIQQEIWTARNRDM